MPTSFQRHLTVSRATSDSRARWRERRLHDMPFIRLKGRWLNQAGFAIGKCVRVVVTPGRLVLEIDERD